MFMLKRFGKPEMSGIWEPSARFLKWLLAEDAVLRAKNELGYIRVNIPPDYLSRVVIDPDEINRIEDDVTKHDVLAFLRHVSPQLPEELRSHLHSGMTSYCVVDPALILTIRESIDQLDKRMTGLMAVLKRQAIKHKYAPMMFRSHLVHAEPGTFGVKLINYYAQLKRERKMLREVKKKISVGKFSGAVGMYVLPPEVEALACKYLGLRPVIATQIISRDIIALYTNQLAIIAGTLEHIGTNIRLMQSTEVREVQEYFSQDQRGSSAMPHKRNPILSENVSGLAIMIRAYASAMLELIATWHERDLSNSGPERIILPDASILLDFMLQRMTGVVDQLIIYPDRMLKNISILKGLAYSQEVLLLIAEKSGLPRDIAYDLPRDIAQRCLDEDLDFLEELLKSHEVMSYVTEQELRKAFELEGKLKHVDHIFKLAEKA